VGDFPAVPIYRQHLGLTYRALGRMHKNGGELAKAEAAYRQALDLFTKLADNTPTVPGPRKDLAAMHSHMGGLLTALGKHTEAVEAYRQALALIEGLAGEFPAVPEYRRQQGDVHTDLGALLQTMGRPVEAEQEYRRALGLQTTLIEESPAVIYNHLSLARTCVALGDLDRGRGRPAEALDWYAKAIGTLDTAPEKDKPFTLVRKYLVSAHSHRALALAGLGRHGEALSDWDLAAELDDPKDPGPRLGRAQTLIKLGDHARAAAELRALAKRNEAPAEYRYNLACLTALCSAAAGQDQGLPVAQRQRLVDEYAQDALRLLRDAIARGYQDVEHLKKDADFDSLRTRDEYQRLVRELEAKAKAGTEKQP
jgi:serine/threonine-protein kinase